MITESFKERSSMWHVVAKRRKEIIPACAHCQPSLLGIYPTERIAKLFAAQKREQLCPRGAMTRFEIVVEREGTTFLIR